MRRLALAALILLAGCGDSSHPAVSARVVSTAAAKTTEASTARYADKISGTFNGESFGGGGSHGAVDNSRRRADITYDLSFLAKLRKGSNPDLLKGRVVLVGNNAFATGPAIVAKLPAGRSWVEGTIDQVAGSGGLSSLGAVDPMTPVDPLRATDGRTEMLGTETVNDTSTRHYRTQIDYRLYVSLVPRDRRAALEKYLATLARLLSRTRFPVEAWIASDGTIRRVKGILEGRGLKVEYTLELTAVGRPVRIRQPGRIHVLDGRKPP